MKPVNDVVFFAVELAALAAFGVWGWHVGSGVWRFVLVVAAQTRTSKPTLRPVGQNCAAGPMRQRRERQVDAGS